MASKLLGSVTTAALQLPIGTQLLIAAYLTKIDNLADESIYDFSEDKSNEGLQPRSRFSDKLRSIRNDFEYFVDSVADQLTQDVSSLSDKFDTKKELNKRLIELCVKKGIFVDGSQQSVVATLITYGEELRPQVEEKSDTSGFIPDIQSIR